MNKEDIAFCGLDCALCRQKFANIREKIADLNESLETVNIEEVVKMIPFMQGKYKKYKKFTEFFSNICPGCRNKGGNPFCGIRKCASKKGYHTCAECDSLCGKFDALFKVHNDNEIQINIERIKTEKLS